MITERERQLLDWIEENPLISQQELANRAGITRSSVAVHISNLMKKGLIQGKGYILQKSSYVVVAGAVNMDISGSPFVSLIPKDSNPGKVHLSLGGVGRNIAHNLALMGTDVKFITAFGEDVYAEQIIKSCRELGIDISSSLTVHGEATSTYLFITNHHGDMELAVSDMEIYRHLTPQFFSSRMELINKARLCVVDTNLPPETISFIAENCTVPLFADTVSSTKAAKLLPVLKYLHTIKANRLEAQLLSGIEISDDVSLRQAASKLLQAGIKRVFISLGQAGVYYADNQSEAKLPCYPAKILNTTGAGDSFMAALAWAYLQDYDMAHSAKAGLAAASICIASQETISPDISPENLKAVIYRNQEA